MLTDRDITVRSISKGHDPKTHQVREVMTSDIFFCFEDQDVKEVADVMREKQVRRLPVLDRSKRLTGIVSLGDIATEVEDEKLAGRALEGISEPSNPRRSDISDVSGDGRGGLSGGGKL
jgi:predicted transcriptional regulator